MIDKSAISRFEQKIDKTAGCGCWLWTASRRRSGYGAFGYKHRSLDAHRFAFIAFKGPIPTGMDVCHTCDIPHCVNPDHLFLGTHKENMQDAKRKGRMSPPPRAEIHWTKAYPERVLRGEKAINSILTERICLDILTLKASGVAPKVIAERLGIRRIAVDEVISGKRWKHVRNNPLAPTEESIKAAKIKKPSAKITPQMATSIKARLAAGEQGSALAIEYGIHKASVSDIKRGLTWKDA